MDAKKYTWGLGIEHEMHLFHIPDFQTEFNNIIVFDAESTVKRILKDYLKNKINLTKSEYDFLKGIPFELSGRVCNGKKIIDKIPIKMPELITSYPFCSVDRFRVKRALEDISEYKKKLIKILNKDELTKKLVKEYGKLDEYPYGMSRYIKYGTVKNDKYVFKKDLKKEDKLFVDYTGSYHITITLPYTKNMKNDEFVKMHQNFCNQFQWIEPILLIALFSGDEYAPGSKKERVRGSFRMMNLGWGNIAGSDVRLFNEGIGRYAKRKIYWRERFLLDETDKLKPCIKPSPYAKKEGGITSYGTDFRTFGENEKGVRVSGYPMKKPNGIEIRIFDNFDSKNLFSLFVFIFLLIENSMNYNTNSYVYENKIWIKQMQNIMKFGYTAPIDKNFIKLIEDKLNLKIKLEENLNLYCCLLNSLHKKNKNGFYFNLLINSENYSLPKKIEINNFYLNVNEKAWETAFLIKLNRNEKLKEKVNQFLKIIEYLNKISYEKTHDLILMILGNNWKYDVDNILIFLRNLNWIKYKNINYKKNLITINKKYILEFNEKRIQAILYDKFVDRLGYMNYSYMKWSNILNNNN